MQALNEWNRNLTQIIVDTMNFKDVATLRALRTREYTALFDKRFADAMAKVYKFESDKIFAISKAIQDIKDTYQRGLDDARMQIKKARFWQVYKKRQLSYACKSYNHKITALALAIAIVEGCKPPKLEQ